MEDYDDNDDLQEESNFTPAEAALVDKAIAMLAEHFDTVQIFITKFDRDTTSAGTKGSGNFYARRGQIRDWMIREDEIVRE